MISKVFRIRRRSTLPFYCDPLMLFSFIWLVMLGSLAYKITDVSYPDFGLPVAIFIASLLSFLFGFHFVRSIYWKEIDTCATALYAIDMARLRQFNLIVALGAVTLLAYNYVAFGPPPLFALFGFSTLSVNDYGKFKQALGPMLTAVFVTAFLEVSIKRRAFYAGFAFLSMLSMEARGGILLMLFQTLIVLSIRSSASKKKIYLTAIVSVVLAAILFGVVGSYRTTDAILFAGMQIKPAYQEWPTIYVWVISYLSTAISNLCWFVDLARFDHVTWSFSYMLLPAFWTPLNPHDDIMHVSKIVDGTSTYLANYYLDFSYFGIFAINAVIGAVSGYASIANRISRQFLSWSVFLSCIGFSFFWDFFADLSTVILFGLQITAQWYFIRELPMKSSRQKRTLARGWNQEEVSRAGGLSSCDSATNSP